ncbi:MAG: hypothetical protein ACQSGP_14215 [Frankia sp.]
MRFTRAVLAALGLAGAGKTAGEQTLARALYPRLESDWLLIADPNFPSGSATRTKCRSCRDVRKTH